MFSPVNVQLHYQSYDTMFSPVKAALPRLRHYIQSGQGCTTEATTLFSLPTLQDQSYDTSKTKTTPKNDSTTKATTPSSPRLYNESCTAKTTTLLHSSIVSQILQQCSVPDTQCSSVVSQILQQRSIPILQQCSVPILQQCSVPDTTTMWCPRYYSSVVSGRGVVSQILQQCGVRDTTAVECPRYSSSVVVSQILQQCGVPDTTAVYCPRYYSGVVSQMLQQCSVKDLFPEGENLWQCLYSQAHGWLS